MSDNFYKFPTTPHLVAPTECNIREDKVFTSSERAQFLMQSLLVEEKIDGANLGISYDDCGELVLQNRGSLLIPPLLGQWKKVEEWLQPRRDDLWEILGIQYILFGEWCYARHSLHYTRLPDWFIAFDLFDKKEQRFLSTLKRNSLLESISLSTAPLLGKGHYSLAELQKLLANSQFGDVQAEGLYLRVDNEDWLLERAKLLRTDFIQTINTHWSQGSLVTNRLSNQPPIQGQI